MNRREMPAPRRRRPPQKNNAWLGYLLLVCFALVLITQITLGVQLNARSKQVARVDAQIRELEIQKESLEVYLSMYQSIDRVKARAEALGMKLPDETQIRVVSVPGLEGTQSAQAAEYTAAETSMR